MKSTPIKTKPYHTQRIHIENEIERERKKMGNKIIQHAVDSVGTVDTTLSILSLNKRSLLFLYPKTSEASGVSDVSTLAIRFTCSRNLFRSFTIFFRCPSVENVMNIAEFYQALDFGSQMYQQYVCRYEKHVLGE